MNTVFLGPLRYWLCLLALAIGLCVLGVNAVHVRHFLVFLLCVSAGVAVVVCYIVLSYQPGVQVTRESLPKSGENL